MLAPAYIKRNLHSRRDLWDGHAKTRKALRLLVPVVFFLKFSKHLQKIWLLVRF